PIFTASCPGDSAMALESALQNLETALADLHEKLVELHLNLDQYTPSETADLLAKNALPPPPVVSLAEKVTEMIAGVEQACAAARQAALSARHPPRIKEAQQALAIAQQHVADALEIFLNQITADHTAKVLGRMAKEQMAKEEPGEDWLGWLQEVL